MTLYKDFNFRTSIRASDRSILLTNAGCKALPDRNDTEHRVAKFPDFFKIAYETEECEICVVLNLDTVITAMKKKQKSSTGTA